MKLLAPLLGRLLAVYVAVWVLGLAYFLSPPLAIRVIAATNPPREIRYALNVFYGPAVRLSMRWKPYRSYLPLEDVLYTDISSPVWNPYVIK